MKSSRCAFVSKLLFILYWTDFVSGVIKINYNALREAYQALQELRETGAEVALREVTALNEGRLNGEYGRVMYEIVPAD